MGRNWLSDDSAKESKKLAPRFWYIIKIAEYVLIAFCILLLMINEYQSVVKDDFTPAYSNRTAKPQPTTTTSPPPSSTTAKPRSKDRRKFKGVDAEYHPQHHPELKLSYLLILYPSCITIVIFFSMEVLARVFKDPLNKISNLILLSVCIALCITVFTLSLISAINTIYVPIILVAVLSCALLVAMIINLTLLIIC